MVSITEEEEHGVPRCTARGFDPGMDAPIMSITNEDGEECRLPEDGEEEDRERTCTCTRRYWEDEDDIYQEFEELDFEALLDATDTCSMASDDSFYPPDSSDGSLLSGPDSPEPVSFFRACCNNNAVIVKIMIRQGVTAEEVRETDRNRRVGGFNLTFDPSRTSGPLGGFSRRNKQELLHRFPSVMKSSFCPLASQMGIKGEMTPY